MIGYYIRVSLSLQAPEVLFAAPRSFWMVCLSFCPMTQLHAVEPSKMVPVFLQPYASLLKMEIANSCIYMV